MKTRLKSKSFIVFITMVSVVFGLVVFQVSRGWMSETEFQQRATLLANEQNWLALETLAKKWQQSQPGSPMSHAALADAQRMTGRYAHALVEYNKALQLDPANYQFWAFHGIMSLENQKFIEATSSCGKSIELQPTYSDAWYCMALASAELGDKEKADEALINLRTLNQQLHHTVLGVIKSHTCIKHKSRLGTLCE